MASTGGGELDPAPLVRMIRAPGMLNRNLSAICKAEGLPVAGVKAVLQERLIEAVQNSAEFGNVSTFKRLRDMLQNPTKAFGDTPPRLGNYAQLGTPSPAMPRHNYGNGVHRPYPSLLAIEFKPTPFYTIEQQLGDLKTCEVMTQNRHTVQVSFKADSFPLLSHVRVDQEVRVMIMCAGDNHGVQDIAFPHQSEVRVNGNDVKANLRGLKNKPGSTRPVDITTEIRTRPSSFLNTVDMTYALTQKKFYFTVKLVRKVSVATLVQKLENGKRLIKESVKREMINKANDADIQTTSTVLSLKCPLSTLRIDLPCRSVLCRHNQCFDGMSYLQLQEQGPTWSCPICNIPAPFENLLVDEYMRDILKNTSKSIEQVTIEPNGDWSRHAKTEPSTSNGASFGSDDDDDLVEINNTRSVSRPSIMNDHAFAENLFPPFTPPISSREPSNSVPPKSNKRSAVVIDLTLSDDDDEPIARAPKRQHMSSSYSTPQNLPYHPQSHV